MPPKSKKQQKPDPAAIGHTLSTELQDMIHAKTIAAPTDEHSEIFDSLSETEKEGITVVGYRVDEKTNELSVVYCTSTGTRRTRLPLEAPKPDQD